MTPNDHLPPDIMSTTQTEDFAQPSSIHPPRLPSLRTGIDTSASASMTASSTPLGALNAARRPGPPPPLASARGAGLPQDLQAKMRAFHLTRQGAPAVQTLRMPGNPAMHSTSASQVPSLGSPLPSGSIGASPVLPSVLSPGAVGGPVGGPLVSGLGGFRLPPNGRPTVQNSVSAPAVPHLKMGPKTSLAAKRGLNRGLKLSEASGPSPLSGSEGMDMGSMNGTEKVTKESHPTEHTGIGKSDSMFSRYEEFVDTKTGTLKFKGKATIDGKGIEFSSGSSFKISLDEVDNMEELGKGNYGTVYRVRHSRPQMRRPGLGLQGNKPPPLIPVSSNSSSSPTSASLRADPEQPGTANPTDSPTSKTQGNTSGVVMAMKEIRLELDEAKFAAIIMELDILHRCISPFIIDFYGAFFQEGAVYICMEFMDGGSIDKLYGDGVPEGVLQKITMATVMGLRSLKDDHNIIHRDVKPTNILVNSRGQVKICDFGVSGNLVASIAKTNIGCQSYMAPERIASGGVAQAGANPGGGTYSVQSDIWSLGLSIIECAMGQYPYPPETYNNIFSQLSVSLLVYWSPREASQCITNKLRLSLMVSHRIYQRLGFRNRHAILYEAVLIRLQDFAPHTPC